VRALTTSLRFLQSTEAVWLVTARVKERDSIEPAIEYLEWHGISRVRHYDIPDRSIRRGGRLQLDAAQTCGAGLLVMGGYGHALRRETVLSGATREALSAMTMPLPPDALNGVGRNILKKRASPVSRTVATFAACSSMIANISMGALTLTRCRRP
jgi:hypothetical protein